MNASRPAFVAIERVERLEAELRELRQQLVAERQRTAAALQRAAVLEEAQRRAWRLALDLVPVRQHPKRI